MKVYIEKNTELKQKANNDYEIMKKISLSKWIIFYLEEQ